MHASARRRSWLPGLDRHDYWRHASRRTQLLKLPTVGMAPRSMLVQDVHRHDDPCKSCTRNERSGASTKASTSHLTWCMVCINPGCVAGAKKVRSSDARCPGIFENLIEIGGRLEAFIAAVFQETYSDRAGKQLTVNCQPGLSPLGGCVAYLKRKQATLRRC